MKKIPAPVLFFCILFLLATPLVCGQKFYDSPKYGKVSEEEWNLTQFEGDPTADAVVLFDIGSVYLDNNFNIVFERHYRIKLFNREAFEYADREEVYMKGETFNIDAQTLTQGADGKTVAQEIEKKQFFEADYTQDYMKKSFAYPGVKEGCIIECKYRRSPVSPVYLRDWYFQNENLPTLHSQYNLSVPYGWDYTVLYKGLHPLTSKSEKDFSLTMPNNAKVYGTTFTWNVDTVPKMEVEPYMGSIYDNIDQISGRMNSYVSLGGSYRTQISSSWEKIKADYQASPMFGDKLEGGGFFKKIIEANPDLISNDPIQNAKNIYNFVQQKIAWNRRYGQVPNQDKLSTIYEQHSGNSAGINFVLINLLRMAGLNATPVLISTRANGVVERTYSSPTQFNHVVVLLTTDKQDFFLDAIDKKIPFGMLPKESLNRIGLLIDKTKEVQWAQTSVQIGYQANRKMMLTVNEQGEVSGSMRLTELGYNGYERRALMLKDGEQTAIKEYYTELLPNIVIDSFKVNNLNNDTLPLMTTLYFKVPQGAQISGKNLYLNPNIFEVGKENPFKAEERNSPIDFGAAFDLQYTTTIKVPTGYVLDVNTDEQLTITSDSSAYHQRKFVVNSSVIQVMDKFKVSKFYYKIDEYADLRRVFSALYSDNTIAFKKQ